MESKATKKKKKKYTQMRHASCRRPSGCKPQHDIGTALQIIRIMDDHAEEFNLYIPPRKHSKWQGRGQEKREEREKSCHV